MSGWRRDLTVLAVLALPLLGLALAWPRLADVKLQGHAERLAALYRAVAVRHTVDVEPPDEPHLTPDREPATAACLMAPAFGAAGIVTRARDRWPADARNPLYELALALGCLTCMVAGVAVLARGLAVAHGAPVRAAVAVLATACGTPLLDALFARPDPVAALAFLFASLVVAARTHPRVPASVEVACAATVALLEPLAAGWLLLAAWDVLRPMREDREESSIPGTLAALVVLALPQMLAWNARGHPALPELRLRLDHALPGLAVVRPMLVVGLFGLALRTLRERGAIRLWVPLLFSVPLAVDGQGLFATHATDASPGALALCALAPLAFGIGELIDRGRRGGLVPAFLVMLVLSAVVVGNAASALDRRTAGAFDTPPWEALVHLTSDRPPVPHSEQPATADSDLALLSPGVLEAATVSLVLGSAWLALILRWPRFPLYGVVLLASCGAAALVDATAHTRTLHRVSDQRIPDDAMCHDFPGPMAATRIELEGALCHDGRRRDDPDGPGELIVQDAHGRTFAWPLLRGVEIADPLPFPTDPGLRAHIASYSERGAAYRMVRDFPFQLQVVHVEVTRPLTRPRFRLLSAERLR